MEPSWGASASFESTARPASCGKCTCGPPFAGRARAAACWNTRSPLTTAIALYRSYGFRPVAREHQTARCDQSFILDL